MRESKITRTIVTTEATVLCLDIDTAEPCNRTFVIPRQPKKDSDIIKFAAVALKDEPNLRPVHVVDINVKETLYGMSESVFLKYAKPMEPRKAAEQPPIDGGAVATEQA